MITLQYCVPSNLFKKYLNEVEKKKDTQTVEGYWLPSISLEKPKYSYSGLQSFLLMPFRLAYLLA